MGYTVFLHLNEGRKECGVHCFSPGVGKTRNETKQETKQETTPIITTKPKTLKPSPNGAQYSANSAQYSANSAQYSPNSAQTNSLANVLPVWTKYTAPSTRLAR